MTTARIFILLAALLGFTGVAIGAFGAHGLAAYFAANPTRESTFRTATLYHLFHAAALFGAAWAVDHFGGGAAVWAGGFLFAGTVIFSGALYLLSVFQIRIMGVVAPIGGVCLLIGWAGLAWAAWQGAV